MNGFYQTNLGVRPEVSLAVLNSNDWRRVNTDMPYGMPYYAPVQKKLVSSANA
jgi:hypothetical protein